MRSDENLQAWVKVGWKFANMSKKPSIWFIIWLLLRKLRDHFKTQLAVDRTEPPLFRTITTGQNQRFHAVNRGLCFEVVPIMSYYIFIHYLIFMTDMILWACKWQKSMYLSFDFFIAKRSIRFAGYIVTVLGLILFSYLLFCLGSNSCGLDFFS